MQITSRKYRHLASVQAVYIINVVFNLQGLDKVGDTYNLKGMAIAQELRLFNDNTRILSKRVRNARKFTAWCLFGIDRYALYLNHTLPN